MPESVVVNGALPDRRHAVAEKFSGAAKISAVADDIVPHLRMRLKSKTKNLNLNVRAF
jgi:hypothetical protein